jgi:tetratricopeptide (TPR) repeat protein
MAKKNSDQGSASSENVEFVEVKGESKFNPESFIQNNQKNLTYIVGGMVAIALLYFGYKMLYLAPKQKEAISAMYKAETLFAQDSFAQALEKPGGEAEGFLDIINNYGGTKAANLAKYYAGVCYLNLGKYEDAISYLEDYDAPDDLTAASRAGALGDAYAESGEKDKATNYYKQASEATDNEMLAPYYLNKLALYYYVEGKNAESLKSFKSLVDNYPDAEQSAEAKKYIARLE